MKKIIGIVLGCALVLTAAFFVRSALADRQSNPGQELTMPAGENVSAPGEDLAAK